MRVACWNREARAAILRESLEEYQADDKEHRENAGQDETDDAERPRPSPKPECSQYGYTRQHKPQDWREEEEQGNDCQELENERNLVGEELAYPRAFIFLKIANG